MATNLRSATTPSQEATRILSIVWEPNDHEVARFDEAEDPVWEPANA